MTAILHWEKIVKCKDNIIGKFLSGFSSAGVNITIIEINDRLLADEDKELSKVFQEVTKKRGINVLLITKVNRVLKDGESFSWNGHFRNERPSGQLLRLKCSVLIR
jgi:pyruvate/2-oxoglutarate dehydrogenase complex dihydrolipoamide dehydrogenase (E3) component